MSKSEEKIENVFLKLIETYPIEDINIPLLTKNLHMARQSFYYHYQSIYDLIYSIFYTKKIKCGNYSSFKEIIKELQAFLEKYKSLCVKISNSNAVDILEEFLYSYLFKGIKEYIKTKSLIENNEYITFLASGFKEIILNKIKEGNIDLILGEIKSLLKDNILNRYLISDLQ